jgi:hypothetical protein
MKLSNVPAKLTWMQSKAVRILAATTLAGAMFAAAAPAASAQQVFVGAHFSGPYRYVAPAPPVRFVRHDDWRYRHDDWRFHHDYRR